MSSMDIIKKMYSVSENKLLTMKQRILKLEQNVEWDNYFDKWNVENLPLRDINRDDFFINIIYNFKSDGSYYAWFETNWMRQHNYWLKLTDGETNMSDDSNDQTQHLHWNFINKFTIGEHFWEDYPMFCNIDYVHFKS